MYAIVYTKTALKDIPKLKAAHLDGKAKDLIAVIRENPYQNPHAFFILQNAHRKRFSDSTLKA